VSHVKKRILFALLALGASWNLGAAVPRNLQIALDEQQRLAAASPADAQIHNDLGNLLELAGDREGAEAAYQKAATIDPTLTSARFNLALLYQQMGRNGKAIDLLQEVVAIDRTHPAANFQLGALYEARGRRTKAIEHYAVAFAHDPTLTFARNNPQLLDSKLATEALLETGRYLDRDQSRVPREYSERARIRELMLSKSPAVAVATPVAPETPVATEQAAGATTPRVLTNDDLQSSGNRPRAVGATPRDRRNAAKGGAYAPGQPVNQRGAAAGTTVGVTVGEPSTAPGTTTIVQPTYVQPTYVQPVGEPNPEKLQAPPEPGVVLPGSSPLPTEQPDRFRPSRRSTASLEWRLAPPAAERQG
jgi:hypothetical protein